MAKNIINMRSQSHILEDESILKLKQRLPNYWVVRDKPKDYGLDLEVEMFDPEGNPTGLVFWVQLKATAEPKEKKAETFRIKHPKLNQYLSYSIPVLIVRYISKGERIMYKWAGEIPLREDKKGYTIKFNAELNDVSLFERYVQKYLLRHRVRHNIANETPISIDILNDSTGGKKSLGTLIKLRRIVEFESGFLKLQKGNSIVDIRVHLERDGFVIVLLDSAHQFISYSNTKDDYDVEELTKVLVQGLFSCFLQLRAYNAVLEILKRHQTLLDQVVRDEDLFMKSLPFLIEISSKSEINFLKNLMRIADSGSELLRQVDMTIMSVVLIAKAKPDIDLSIYEEFFLWNIEFRKQFGIPEFDGTAFYNLGSLYRVQGKFSSSISAYNHARKLKPTYLEKTYFHMELGGVFFLSEHYHCATKAYKRALDLSESEEERLSLNCAYGDCLLYSGEYAAARDSYGHYLDSTEDDFDYNEEWQLKYLALSSLIMNGYPETQNRNNVESDKRIQEGDFHGALEADLLNYDAWYFEAADGLLKEDCMQAFLASIMSLVIYPYCVGPFVNAFLAYWNCLAEGKQTEFNVLVFLCRLAYKYHGERFAEVVHETLKSSDVNNVEEIINFLDRLFVVPKSKPNIIRFNEIDGDSPRTIKF